MTGLIDGSHDRPLMSPDFALLLVSVDCHNGMTSQTLVLGEEKHICVTHETTDGDDTP